MTNRTVKVTLIAQADKFVVPMERAAKSVGPLRKELAAAASAGKLDHLADQAGKMGIGITAGVAAAIAVTAKFDKQMSSVQATTNAAGAELGRLRTAAIEAGRATTFSATEAATAETELARASLTSSEILGGALRGSLSLAAAGQLDLSEAADVSAKTMNVFGLQGADVSHIADVLAASANKSATDVHELGEAMKMGGLAAHGAGMSLEETVATLSAFADHALSGSDAGTSLKTMLMRLEAPTGEAADEMRRLGIEAYDAQGNFIGTTKLAGVLQASLADLTQQERNAALATIFGADAMRAANVLLDVGEQKMRDYTKAVNDQGAASRAAAQMTDNLMGDVERLNGSLESLTIKAGGGATDALRKVTQALGAYVDTLNDAPDVLSNTVLLIGAVTGATLLGVAAWIKMRGATAAALEELAKTGPVGATAAKGLGTVSKYAGRATAAFLALEVVTTIARSFADAAADTDQLAASLDHLADSGEKTGELTRVFGSDLDQLGHDIEFIKNTGGLQEAIKGANWEPGFMEAFDWSLASTVNRMKALDDTLAQMQSGGHGRQAAAAFQLIQQRATQAGVSVDQLKLMFPSYTAALDGAKTATTGAATAQEKAAAKSRTLASGLAAAVQEAGSLLELFNQLNGSALGWAQAEDDLEASFDAATKAIKENGKTAIEHGAALENDSEKGRENRKALRDIAESAKAAMQARFDDTHSLEDANRVYEEARAKFIAAAEAAGLTEKAAKDLAGAWLSMPSSVLTEVKTPGLSDAQRALNKFNTDLFLIPSSVKVSVAFNRGVSTHSASANRWGGLYEKAAVGTLRNAAVYSARSPGRYMIAEPETGGEAFIPRKGDYGRSMSILSEAARWHGASVVPNRTWHPNGAARGWQTTATRSTVVHEHRHTITLSGEELMSGFRRDIGLRGGSTEMATSARRPR